jgi:hypothetical protein
MFLNRESWHEVAAGMAANGNRKTPGLGSEFVLRNDVSQPMTVAMRWQPECLRTTTKSDAAASLLQRPHNEIAGGREC